MMKTGWWSINFELTLDGEKVFWDDLDEVTQEHIAECIKEGYMCGEIIVEGDSIEMIKDYFDDIDLGDYDLDGIEFTDDDFETMAERFERENDLEKVVHEYLLEVREVLDNGLKDCYEEELEDD